MIIEEQKVILQNGREVQIRSACEADAEAVCNYRHITSGETYFMARYPEEVSMDIEEMAKRLAATVRDERNFELVAVCNGKIVGGTGVSVVKNHLKYQHRANVGISIMSEFCNGGLGSALLETAIKQAGKNGFEQLELGVFSDNRRAIHVYEKCGFVQVGIIPRAYKLKDGTYRDEVQMVYLLENIV